MERLRYVIAYTPAIEPLKAYYRDSLGLQVETDSPFWVDFESGEGIALGLVAVDRDQKREIELCFEVRDIQSEVVSLSARGVEFIDEIRDHSFGRLIHLRDPEGNLVSLLQPPAAGRTAGEAGEVGLSTGTMVAVQAGPRLSTAIINCREMAKVRSFYHSKLGLAVGTDSQWWVEFEIGPTRLALHPRVDQPERETHHGQNITIGFAIDDLIAWADEARGRGVHFDSAPEDAGWGLHADVTDPEGYELTFREPQPPKTVEEELAEAFEDDPTPPQAPMRKTVAKRSPAISRVVHKPEYKVDAKKKAAVKPRSKATKKLAIGSARVRSPRGTGPAGTRQKPKRLADPKRARTRPATGRLKKAERRTLESKKKAVASTSKSKPVKKAVARKPLRKVVKKVQRKVQRKVGKKR